MLQKAIWMQMTITMSDDSYNDGRENLKKVFKDINTQKEGEISREEFTTFVKETYSRNYAFYEKMSDQEVEDLSTKLFEKAMHHDGDMQWTEFLNINMAKRHKNDTKLELVFNAIVRSQVKRNAKEKYCCIDTKKGRKIDKEALKLIFGERKVREQVVNNIFSQFDHEDDNKFNLDEFMVAMNM